MTKIYFNPIHLKQFYKENFCYKEKDFPVSENISLTVLSTPIYPTLSKDELDYIITSIKESLK